LIEVEHKRQFRTEGRQNLALKDGRHSGGDADEPVLEFTGADWLALPLKSSLAPNALVLCCFVPRIRFAWTTVLGLGSRSTRHYRVLVEIEPFLSEWRFLGSQRENK
jgi:hypothetical protein